MPGTNELYGFVGRENDGRRKPPTERTTYNIKQLWQRSHAIINLAAQGWKQNEIARILNIHPQTVSNTLNSDLGEAKLSDLRQEQDADAKINIERIQYLTSRALDVYAELFDNENGEATLKDRVGGAKDVLLELSGLRAVQTVHAVHTTLTMDEIEAMKSRGRAFIDVTPKENENE